MSDGSKITCPSCGKSYAVRAEHAGRKVRCKCGTVMVVPSALGNSGGGAGGNAAETGGERVSCPECGATLGAAAVLCVQCGYNLKTGARVGGVAPADSSPESPQESLPKSHPGSARRSGRVSPAPAQPPKVGHEARRAELESADQEAQFRHARMVDVYAPIGLIVIGVVSLVVQELKFSDTPDTSLLQALIPVAARVVLCLPLMVVALLLTARILSLSFGSIPTALLKLMAILLAPAGFAAILAFVTGPGLLTLLWAFILEIAVYYGLLMWMFDLDFFEAFVTSIVIYVINMAAGMVVLGVLLH